MTNLLHRTVVVVAALLLLHVVCTTSFAAAADDVRRLDTNGSIAANAKQRRRQLALVTVGSDGSPASAYPLQKCQGDCDDDSDCQSGLKCFMRDGGDTRPVPGCSGTPGSARTDFCYDPKDGSGGGTGGTAPTKPSSPSAPKPSSPTAPKPSPTSGGTLKDRGNNWSPSDAYKLGLCEGDCDGDYDCEGDLVCHQRDGTRKVPGCAGSGTADRDYCVKPGDETATPPVSGAFRLKLYWEYGYDWQQEFWEQEWCMRCDGSDCNSGDDINIHYCDDKSTWFVFDNMSSNGQTQVKIANTKLCLEWNDNYDMYVKTCDKSTDRQKFDAGQGSFSGKRFELRTSDDGCLTQDHHPRDGELVFVEDCDTPRDDDTSYWNKY